MSLEAGATWRGLGGRKGGVGAEPGSPGARMLPEQDLPAGAASGIIETGLVAAWPRSTKFFRVSAELGNLNLVWWLARWQMVAFEVCPDTWQMLLVCGDSNTCSVHFIVKSN